MTSAKQVILTAIHNKGTAQVRREANILADGCLCSRAYVLNLIRQVEKGDIRTQSR
jgi:predicted transcriptional regulator YheO